MSIHLLRNADIVVGNTSGGKDSQAKLDWLAGVGAIAGCLDKIVAVHCDLGRIEWPGTRELAQEQAEAYGFPFYVVQRDQDLLDHIEQHGKFPGADTRFCTSDHKTGQVYKLFTRLVNEWRERTGETRPCRILNCLGIRADEGDRRKAEIAKLTSDGADGVYGPDVRASNKTRRHVTRYYPIAHWTTAQVWDRIENSGVRHHWAYDLGMSRLSCCFCVFASRKDLLISARANPDLLDLYCKVEEKIGHQFTARISIRDIRDEVAA